MVEKHSIMKTKLLSLLASFAALAVGAVDSSRLQTNCPACDDLIWQLAITPYSFRLYPFSEAIDKTAEATKVSRRVLRGM